MSYRRLEQKCMFANSKTKCPLFSVTSRLHNEKPKPLYAKAVFHAHLIENTEVQYLLSVKVHTFVYFCCDGG